MARTPRLDTQRRQMFATRCWVAEKLREARLAPVKGLPLSYRGAAKELKLDSSYLQMVEVGRRLPRYRRALDMMLWIRQRLGYTPTKEEA